MFRLEILYTLENVFGSYNLYSSYNLFYSHVPIVPLAHKNDSKQREVLQYGGNEINANCQKHLNL